jgi:phosphodiesterase/alkaline phosphatase D-like protein
VTPAVNALTTCARRPGFLLFWATALAVCPALAVTLIHRPYLQNMRTDRVTIMWSTRESMPGTVEYSTDRSTYRTAIPRIRILTPSQTHLSYTLYQYQADLTGLSPDTQYFYEVVMDGQKITTDEESQFRTAGAVPFRFLVFGDSGAGTTAERSLAVLMTAEQASLVLHVGDIAYEDGTFAQFTDNYFESLLSKTGLTSD